MALTPVITARRIRRWSAPGFRGAFAPASELIGCDVGWPPFFLIRQVEKQMGLQPRLQPQVLSAQLSLQTHELRFASKFEVHTETDGVHLKIDQVCETALPTSRPRKIVIGFSKIDVGVFDPQRDGVRDRVLETEARHPTHVGIAAVQN